MVIKWSGLAVVWLTAFPGLPLADEFSILSGSPGDGADIAVESCVNQPSPLAVMAPALAELDAESWHQGRNLAQLVAELEQLADDGLDPEHYFLADIRRAAEVAGAGEPLDLCQRERASYGLLRALHDLGYGRLSPARAGDVWYGPGQHPDLGAEQQLAEWGRLAVRDPAAAFAAARPTLPRYVGLRDYYREYRRNLPPAHLELPSGPLLRPGARDPRVPALRKRLEAEGLLAPGAGVSGDSQFDPQLVVAVKAFQRRHQLGVDGVVGPRTLAELNRSPSQRLAQLKINLERLRWLARDMEPDLLLVDIAGAGVELQRAGQLVWRGRAQVGQPRRETPALKSRVSHVTLNPTWTVPPTIYRNDKLPEIRRDIGYLANNRIRVLDPQGRQLDPYAIDWHNPGRIILRQDAGPASALGLVAIRFANPFAVYLHDTPSQRLFATDRRFYSSGCVRVEGAMGVTELLFSAASEAVKAEFAAILASGKTRNLKVPEPVALVMAYWTAEGDGEGGVSYRPDVYNLDDALLQLLESAR